MQSVPAHYYLPGPEVSVLETQTRSKLRYLQNKAITVRPMRGEKLTKTVLTKFKCD